MARKRKIGSIKSELLEKSKESMLAAVQIFNNPNIHFKSESFIVLAIISWTYLLHAYFREKKIEYRYYEQAGQRKKYHLTKNGAHKYWELERCLNERKSPPFTSDALYKLDYLSFLWLKFIQENDLSTRQFVKKVEDTNKVVVRVKDLTNEGFEFWRRAERFLGGRDFNTDPNTRVNRILVKELKKLRS